MEEMTNTDTKNINTKIYWESRFITNDWEDKGGRSQTAAFAEAQVRLFRLPQSFKGLLIDFGCGLGDAIPVYHKFFPGAKLIGIDVSESAVEKCKYRYGELANFMQGTHLECPVADVIIASNVFEHLSDDIGIAKKLLSKCRELYVTVPYKEKPLCSEHVRSYDENYFRVLGKYDYKIFPSYGWSEYGFQLIKLRVRNILKKLTGHSVQPRRLQIMFHFQNLDNI